MSSWGPSRRSCRSCGSRETEVAYSGNRAEYRCRCGHRWARAHHPGTPAREAMLAALAGDRPEVEELVASMPTEQLEVLRSTVAVLAAVLVGQASQEAGA